MHLKVPKQMLEKSIFSFQIRLISVLLSEHTGKTNSWSLNIKSEWAERHTDQTMTCKNWLVFNVRKWDHKTIKRKMKIVKVLWKVIHQCYYWCHMLHFRKGCQNTWRAIDLALAGLQLPRFLSQTCAVVRPRRVNP